MNENIEAPICRVCKRIAIFGIDGACLKCGAVLCWDCWTKNGYECPVCGGKNERKD